MSDGPEEAGEPPNPRSRQASGTQRDFAARGAGKSKPQAAAGTGPSSDGGFSYRHGGKGSATPVAGSEAGRMNGEVSGRRVFDYLILDGSTKQHISPSELESEKTPS